MPFFQELDDLDHVLGAAGKGDRCGRRFVANNRYNADGRSINQ